MIKVEDILRLTYTPDLTSGGIAGACRSLSHSYTGIGQAAYGRLRHTVAQVAVELAFRRHLVDRGIRFGVRGPAAFTDPDHFNVVLRGRRLDIQTFLITHRQQVLAIQEDPAVLLKAPALVPLDQYAAGGQSTEDVYVFAFLPGMIAESTASGRRSMPAEGPVHLVHLMPGSWAHPRVWMPLGPLVLKSENDGMLEIEIGGQNRNREPLCCPVALPARTRLDLEADFHSVTYLHSGTAPGRRLGIRSPTRRETRVIEATEWHDIWIHGAAIFLAGWITRDQLRQRAKLIHEGTRVFQYSRTRKENLAMPISDLKPIDQLFELARA